MSNHKLLSDTELSIQLKLGNHSAYTEVYNRYFTLMYVFTFKKLRNEELAKDFVQELFLNLWNKRESLSEKGRLSSYLYISIRSRILDHFDHQKVQQKYLDFLQNYQIEAYEKTDHLIREKELESYIERQIETLPRKMREVFKLSRKEHLNHKEISQMLSTSENNVSKQITNALKILSTKLRKISVLMLF